MGQAYDVMRIKLTRRYGLTFANIFEAPKGKSTLKSDDDDKSDADKKAETADGGDPQREKQAAGKLRLA
ncbi:MAG TPA: hypothetical protein PK867_30385, partial [Pirellulales bacterium]|nr:hypothetical protein [Pirellulales bacterium]